MKFVRAGDEVINSRYIRAFKILKATGSHEGKFNLKVSVGDTNIIHNIKEFETLESAEAYLFNLIKHLESK
jgi:hypothetical protein